VPTADDEWADGHPGDAGTGLLHAPRPTPARGDRSDGKADGRHGRCRAAPPAGPRRGRCGQRTTPAPAQLAKEKKAWGRMPSARTPAAESQRLVRVAALDTTGAPGSGAGSSHMVRATDQ
jgi:hypothetical protein